MQESFQIKWRTHIAESTLLARCPYFTTVSILSHSWSPGAVIRSPLRLPLSLSRRHVSGKGDQAPTMPRKLRYKFFLVLRWPTNVLICEFSEGSKIRHSLNSIKVDRKIINGMVFYGFTQPLTCRPHNPGRCAPLFVWALRKMLCTQHDHMNVSLCTQAKFMLLINQNTDIVWRIREILQVLFCFLIMFPISYATAVS